ncbi:AAA family ATPase [Peptoniphilus vaginalis]|uniref:AAA family ATPase n=1 Tax=Peptoniphilus vaginalis TaxID=1756987 RepID=UPI0023F6339B|nr:AAA family ATPase [Peptoniphilus vaginalis]
MIYIKNVELINFQSHNHTEIEFDRGLNVILGNSDAGKTAILRAIKWALFNEPKGDYFIRQGEKDVSVKVTFSNGVVVERSRTPSKNSYYLMDAEGQEMRFEGFGLDVPKEITDAIHMHKVSLDNSNNKVILNIAEQLDGPFLLNDQASMRASAIGRLIGVNYVDDALRTVVRDNKRINQEIDNLRASRDDFKEQLKEFDYIKDYKDKFQKLSHIRDKISDLNQRLNLVSNLKDTYEQYNLEIDNIGILLENFKNLSAIDSVIPKIETNLIKRSTYQSFFDRLNRTESEVTIISNSLEKLNNIESLNEKTKNIEIKKNKLDSFSKLFHKYKNTSNQILDTKKDLDSLKNSDKIAEINKTLDEKISLYNKIFSGRESLLVINDKLNYGNDYIKNFSNNDNIENISKQLEKNIKTLFILSDIQRKLTELQKEYRIETDKLTEVNNNLKNYTETYEKTILEIGVCPFCYSEINKESIDHIKYHLRND